MRSTNYNHISDYSAQIPVGPVQNLHDSEKGAAPMAAPSGGAGGNGGGSRLSLPSAPSRMYFVPEKLEIQETAPRTDEEWDEALEL